MPIVPAMNCRAKHPSLHHRPVFLVVVAARAPAAAVIGRVRLGLPLVGHVRQAHLLQLLAGGEDDAGRAHLLRRVVVLLGRRAGATERETQAAEVAHIDRAPFLQVVGGAEDDAVHAALDVAAGQGGLLGHLVAERFERHAAVRDELRVEELGIRLGILRHVLLGNQSVLDTHVYLLSVFVAEASPTGEKREGASAGLVNKLFSIDN